MSESAGNREDNLYQQFGNKRVKTKPGTIKKGEFSYVLILFSNSVLKLHSELEPQKYDYLTDTLHGTGVNSLTNFMALGLTWVFDSLKKNSVGISLKVQNTSDNLSKLQETYLILIIFQKELNFELKFIALSPPKQLFQDDDAKDVHAGIEKKHLLILIYYIDGYG